MSKQEKSPRQLSQEQIMEGLPPVNIGALFMPPVWGAANGIGWPSCITQHGFWLTTFSIASTLTLVLSQWA